MGPPLVSDRSDIHSVYRQDFHMRGDALFPRSESLPHLDHRLL